MRDLRPFQVFAAISAGCIFAYCWQDFQRPALQLLATIMPATVLGFALFDNQLLFEERLKKEKDDDADNLPPGPPSFG